MQTIMIPAAAQTILETLEKAGYEAYVVGGCVRDTLLGRTPGDWDITTSARPKEVKSLFRRTVDTGIQHGTVTVMMGNTGYEVTTYRIDGEYEDGRHPNRVDFTASLTEDLKRRDFTINAMAFNPRTGIVDEFGGMEDLERGVIRCVGCAEDRFTEDALRILRAVRFSAQLGFSIDPDTECAIRKLAGNLRLISRERVQAEITKLLVSPHPDNFLKLYEFGITPQFFPEFDEMMITPQNTPYHCFSVGDHTLCMLRSIKADPILRWTALLHDCGKPAKRTTDTSGRDHFKGHAEEGAVRAERILKELKFDNHSIDQICKLVWWHDHRFEGGKPAVRKCLHAIGPELFELLLSVFRADNDAKNPSVQNYLQAEVDHTEAMFRDILARGECYSLKTLAVKGKDLIEAGIRPGIEMGDILEDMLDQVMEDPSLNQKDILMKRMEKWREEKALEDAGSVTP